MKSTRIVAVALALALSTLAEGSVSASPATDAFSEACSQNPDFFSFAVQNLGENPEGHAALCSCLVTEFSSHPDADLAILTKDVDGSATPEDRAAYGDYTALELKARDALDICLKSAGLVSDQPVPGGQADMTSFDAACHGSAGLLEVIGGAPDQAAPRRTTLCNCLSTELAPLITTADADILGQDLDGTATEESRNAYSGYAALAETAGVAFNGCFATLEQAPSQ